jgi:hypothetical protein
VAFAEAFVEVLVEVLLLFCTAILFKMDWPQLPLNCIGAAASQIKANAKRIKPHITRFLIFILQNFNRLGFRCTSNSDGYKDAVFQGSAIR